MAADFILSKDRFRESESGITETKTEDKSLIKFQKDFPKNLAHHKSV